MAQEGIRPALPTNASLAARDLIQRSWDSDPTARPTAAAFVSAVDRRERWSEQAGTRRRGDDSAETPTLATVPFDAGLQDGAAAETVASGEHAAAMAKTATLL